MPAWLSGQTDELVGVFGKAALMYGTAVLGLRVAHRRTLSQWTAIDFAAAVAIGAIIGRTAIASGQSNDVIAKLREQGVERLADLRYVLYETKGELTVVRENGSPGDPELVRAGLRDAAGYTAGNAAR